MQALDIMPDVMPIAALCEELDKQATGKHHRALVTRACNALLTCQIDTVGELRRTSVHELKRIPQLGDKGLRLVLSAVAHPHAPPPARICPHCGAPMPRNAQTIDDETMGGGVVQRSDSGQTAAVDFPC